MFGALILFKKKTGDNILIKYPHIKQHDEKDCGAACLSMISAYYNLKLPIAKFRDLVKTDNQGTNIYGLITGAARINLLGEALEGSFEELKDELINNQDLQNPFIARIITPHGFEHFVVIYNYDKSKKEFTVGDPGADKIYKLSEADFEKCWLGQIVSFIRSENFTTGNESKGVLRKFFRYILTQKKLLALIFVLSIVISSINLFGTFIFQYVLDDVSVMTEADTCDDENCTDEHHNHDEQNDSFYDKTISFINKICSNLDTVCIVIIAAYLLKCGFNVMRSYMLAMTTKRINVPLLSDFYNHMTDLPASFFTTRKAGDLISRFQNAEEIKEAISSVTLTVMLDSIMAIAFAVVLFLINKILFLITVVAIIIYGLTVYFFRKPIRKVNHEIMEADAQVTSYFKESVDGINTIRAGRYQSITKNKIKKLITDRENKFVKGGMLRSALNSFVDFIASVTIVILLWVGAYFCVSNIISIGALFTFYSMLDYFIDPVRSLINLQPTIQIATAAAERLNDVLDSDVENNDGKEEFKNADISIDNVSFAYGNRRNVLNNVSFNIFKGQRIALIGESGCGKTTLAKLLLRFYEPDEGEIKIDNKNLSEYDFDSFRSKTAYISQDIFLFSDTIRNNLTMGLESVDENEFKSVCDACRVTDFVKDLPFGFDTILSDNGGDLSVGQRQRIAIARALLRKPELLIMDEATGNLDTQTEKCIHEAIDKLPCNTTCIIIAHRLKTIRNCDKIYVMADGFIKESGTHDELISKNGLYTDFYNTGL